MSNQTSVKNVVNEIHFTERPYGIQSQPKALDPSAQVSVVGFKVTPQERATLQEYADQMYNQWVPDAQTHQPKRMLDQPSIGLLLKLSMKSYQIQYNWFCEAYMKHQAQQTQQAIAQGNGPVKQPQAQPQVQQKGNVGRK